MERPTTSNVMPKRDHERDLELDKKIEALRRKNEALMKRYKEVEEDRKKAEEEGMALQSRKGQADDLTITISKSTDESRVVVTKPSSSESSAGKGQQEPGRDNGEPCTGPVQGSGRGHRKQLTITMAGKKGKRVVSERPEKRPGPSEVKSPTCDKEARHVESAGKGKQQSHPAKREAAAAAQVCVQEQGDSHTDEHPKSQDSEILHASTTDLNIPTSREEQEEYQRWKKEREQIDRERVARHKNAKGQWRRAWDVDKTENMFSDKCLPDRDWGPSGRGGRNARRGQQKAGNDSRGHGKRGKDKAAKNVLVMSSKAKGKDRLTGRARRWQSDDDGENRQASDATLEEFLEELDALTDSNKEDLKDQDSLAKLDSLCAPEEVRDLKEVIVPQKKAQALSPRGSEKKVRFSEELVQNAPAEQPSQDSAGAESKGSLKVPSPKKNKREVERPQLPATKQHDSQGKGGSLPALPVAQQQASESEHTEKERSPPTVPSSPPAEKASASLQPVSKGSSNSANTEELIDSSLSVLRMEARETHQTLSTSSDKAREHGKIV